ncbi:amine-terminal region of chorein, A TM vesicle-mediated sorter, partial [Toxoplasma gondii TgCatPRC2]
MLASAVVDLINNAASEFVVGLDSSQLDFSDLLSGKVDLRHLQLKQAAFDSLSMPVKLLFSYIGRIRVEVPLFSLMTSPLDVEVDDILVVLGTHPADEWDAESFKSVYLNQKEASLQHSEFQSMFSAIESGLTWSMLLTLASNIRASVRNVHVRIEDFHSRKSRPFSIGFCVKHALLHSAPKGADTSEPGFCTPSGSLQENMLFKMISVDGFGFYIDAIADPEWPFSRPHTPARATDTAKRRRGTSVDAGTNRASFASSGSDPDDKRGARRPRKASRLSSASRIRLQSLRSSAEGDSNLFDVGQYGIPRFPGESDNNYNRRMYESLMSRVLEDPSRGDGFARGAYGGQRLREHPGRPRKFMPWDDRDEENSASSPVCSRCSGPSLCCAPTLHGSKGSLSSDTLGEREALPASPRQDVPPRGPALPRFSVAYAPPQAVVPGRNGPAAGPEQSGGGGPLAGAPLAEEGAQRVPAGSAGPPASSLPPSSTPASRTGPEGRRGGIYGLGACMNCRSHTTREEEVVMPDRGPELTQPRISPTESWMPYIAEFCNPVDGQHTGTKRQKADDGDAERGCSRPNFLPKNTQEAEASNAGPGLSQGGDATSRAPRGSRAASSQRDESGWFSNGETPPAWPISLTGNDEYEQTSFLGGPGGSLRKPRVSEKSPENPVEADRRAASSSSIISSVFQDASDARNARQATSGVPRQRGKKAVTARVSFGALEERDSSSSDVPEERDKDAENGSAPRIFASSSLTRHSPPSLSPLSSSGPSSPSSSVSRFTESLPQSTASSPLSSSDSLESRRPLELGTASQRAKFTSSFLLHSSPPFLTLSSTPQTLGTSQSPGPEIHGPSVPDDLWAFPSETDEPGGPKAGAGTGAPSGDASASGAVSRVSPRRDREEDDNSVVYYDAVSSLPSGSGDAHGVDAAVAQEFTFPGKKEQKICGLPSKPAVSFAADRSVSVSNALFSTSPRLVQPRLPSGACQVRTVDRQRPGAQREARDRRAHSVSVPGAGAGETEEPGPQQSRRSIVRGLRRFATRKIMKVGTLVTAFGGLSPGAASDGGCGDAKTSKVGGNAVTSPSADSAFSKKVPYAVGDAEDEPDPTKRLGERGGAGSDAEDEAEFADALSGEEETRDSGESEVGRGCKRVSEAAEKESEASTEAEEDDEGQSREEKKPETKALTLNADKTDGFRAFILSLWDIRHEYIVDPAVLEGQAKLYLSLVPTVPKGGPVVRCWSAWGERRRLPEERTEALPSCALFVTFVDLKITVSEVQALNLWKWLEYYFTLYSLWQGGILGSFEKPRASLHDQELYLKAWPLKLLHATVDSLEDPDLDAGDEGPASATQGPKQRDSVSEATQTPDDLGKATGPEETQGQTDGEETTYDPARVLRSSEEIAAFCKHFEATHSLQTIFILRAKAFHRLKTLREKMGIRSRPRGPLMRLWNFITFGRYAATGSGAKDARESLVGDPEEVAQASRQFFEGLLRQNGVSVARIQDVRDQSVSKDFLLDVVVFDTQLLLTFEGQGVAVPAPRTGQRVLALETSCIHYHLQASKTGDQSISMDVELYPTSILTTGRDLESPYIPPEISPVMLLQPAASRVQVKKKDNVLVNFVNAVFRGGAGREAKVPDFRGDPDREQEALEVDSASSEKDPEARGSPSFFSSLFFGGETREEDVGSQGRGPVEVGRAVADKSKHLSLASTFQLGLGVRKAKNAFDLRKRRDDIVKGWSPGAYMRIDTQLFRTLEKPDVRMLVHSSAELVVLLSVQKLASFFGECLNLLDEATTKELQMSSNLQTVTVLRQGEDFCRAVAEGGISHPNFHLECDLQKTVSAILPRISSSLNCEGIKLNFGHLRASSTLVPRRVSYPRDLPAAEMTDRYTC